MKTGVIMLAGGSGTRMGANINKVLLPVCGITCINRSVSAFAGHCDEMIIVCRNEDLSSIRKEIGKINTTFPVRYVPGGYTRQESVFNGLLSVSNDCEIIAIHDGARCLVDEKTIINSIESASVNGSGVACVDVVDTVKIAGSDHTVVATPNRDQLKAVQTPQSFRRDIIISSYKKAMAEGFIATDDASVAEYAGYKVYLSEGSRKNIKLTSPEDIRMAESMLNNPLSFRVGHGYDVHRLTEGRKLILCGVDIPYTYGLDGHSDADVAVHALMDAMLGSVGLGDIGRHFPDTDEKYKGISSVLLLRHVVSLLHEHGAQVSNCDITIIAQKPKLSPYIPSMIALIASELSLPENSVNIKATTTEHLGFEGREEGISAHAVCMVSVE